MFASTRGPDQVIGAAPTGDVQALLTLADDVYRLRLVDQLPEKILNRLRNVGEFQGVRYEIALAASLVRVGFRISWLESNKTHAEFTASLAESRENIIVEAKSRHRPGVLHRPGNPSELCCLKADVTDLYLNALKKPTADLPFVVGIDVNLPLNLKKIDGTSKWMDDVFRQMDKGPKPTQEKPAKEFLLVLTNFAWHYVGQQRAPAHEVHYLFPEWTSAVPKDKRTFAALIQAFDRYGTRPEGVF